MEYLLSIEQGPKPAINVTLEADNIIDAITNKMALAPELLQIDFNLMGAINVCVDDYEPKEDFRLNKRSNGNWLVADANTNICVEFTAPDFLNTAKVYSLVDPDFDVKSTAGVDFLRHAADWLYLLHRDLVA